MTHPASPPPPKPAWPLLTLGGLAFVPGLGVVFGLIATCWGLLSSRPRAMTAAMLGAAGMLLNFAACGALAYWGASKDYGWSVARAQSINTDLLQLVERLEQHHARTGQYPSRLTDLRVSVFNLPAPEIYDRGVGMLNQSKPYQYQLDPDGRHYLLFSVGLDGKPGTGDEMYPLVPDSLREDTGLRRP